MTAAGAAPTRIFVTGMLRSGTTLLAQLLDQHSAIFAAGELSNLWSTAERGGTCQCGSPVAECSVWSAVLARVLREGPCRNTADAEVLRLRVARSRQLTAWRATVPSSDGLRYVQLQSTLMRAISELTGSSAVVDTSKKAVDLLWAQHTGRTLPIHLVRNPYGVAASEADTSRFAHVPAVDRPPVRSPLRSAANWTVANLLAEQACKRDPAALHWRYEDLVADPVRHLETVRVRNDLPPHGWRFEAERGFYFNTGHILNGNPSRSLAGWHRLRAPAAGASLNRRQKVSVRLVTAPLASYGYRSP